MLVIIVALLFDYLWFTCNLLLLCGKIKLNPWLKSKTAKKLPTFRLNVNSTAAHNFAKLSFLKCINQFLSFM